LNSRKIDSMRNLRTAINAVTQFVEATQLPHGNWIDDSLFPSAQATYMLLQSGIQANETTIDRGLRWLNKHALRETPGDIKGLSLALICLQHEGSVYFSSIALGLEKLLSMQTESGSWGTNCSERERATGTALSLVALQKLENYLTREQRTSACSRACAYLQSYLGGLAVSRHNYLDIVEPLEALLLPNCEVWHIIHQMPNLSRIASQLIDDWKSIAASGSTRAVEGCLSLLLAQWNSIDQETVNELVDWLLQKQNQDGGWPDIPTATSNFLQSINVGLSLRRAERINQFYVPVPVFDLCNASIAKPLEYEYSVSAVLVRKLSKELEILLLERKDQTWVLPKGHVESGENDLAALQREIFEETSIDELAILDELPSYNYIFRPNRRVCVNKTVKYYLVKTESSKLDLFTDQDHEDIRWFPLKDISSLHLFYDDARQAIIAATKTLDKYFDS
jgi:8-oxo-dGTP pyrophosphatase MutT (NUDIX family)